MLKVVMGIIGLILVIIGNVTIYKQKRIRRKYTYPSLIIGTLLLVVYSILIKDTIFIILQSGVVLASVYGFYKIHHRIKHNK